MLTVTNDLSSYTLAAGEPFVLEVQLLDSAGRGTDISDDAMFLTFYTSASRAIVKDYQNRPAQYEGERLSDNTGEFFRFAFDGRFSEAMFGKVGVRVELAQRLLNGRKIIGAGALSVVSSAISVPSLGDASIADAAIRITIKAPLMFGLPPLLSVQAIPYNPDTTPTPTPAPAFTQQPTISPTSGTAGTTTFTATPGIVSNGSITSRAWLLNGTSISEGLTANPQAAGTLTYRETATGAGGTVLSNIISATAAVDNGGGTPTPTPGPDPLLSAPQLYLVSDNLSYPPVLDIGLDDEDQVGNTVRIQWKSGSADFTNPTQEFAHAITAPEANARQASFGLSSITSGTNRFRARVERSTGYGPWSNIVTQGPDDVAPVLSALSSQMVNSTSGKVLFSTDTAEGTARTVLTTANTAPSQAAMDASMNTLAVTTTGAQQIPVGGLTAATLYYAWVQHADATGNKSPITAAGSFTTDSAVAFSMTEVAAPQTQNVNYADTKATFAGLSLGAAQSSRRMIAFPMAFNGSGPPTDVKINGVTATLIPGSVLNWISAWEAIVPDGTTGDVVITGANNWQAVGVKLMRVIGANGSPSVATLPYGFNNAPQTVSVTTPTGGATGVVAYVETLSGTGVWTNATGQSETDNVFATFASAIRATAGAANVSVNGYGNQNSSMLAVSYAP